MRTVDVTWSGEKLAFTVSNDRLPQVKVHLDEPAPLGSDAAFMPTELLLGALGGCVGMNAVALLRKSRQPLVGLMVQVAGEQAESWPKQFTEIDVTFNITWDGQPDADVVSAMLEKAVRSYCPVGATLAPGAVIRHLRREALTGDTN